MKLSAAIPKETQFEERNKIRAASNIPTNKEYDALFLAYTKGVSIFIYLDKTIRGCLLSVVENIHYSISTDNI